MTPITRILCAIDCSECSKAALAAALLMRRKFGAQLEVLHAYGGQPPIQPRLMVWMSTGPRPVWELAEQQRRDWISKIS
jgi:hypothetical protein